MTDERIAGLFHAAAATPTGGPTGPGAMASELQAGQIIGKCRIERELGRGGMGAVYLAHHANLDVPVALKILPPHIAQRDPEFAERFMREARIAAKLKHPNVVACMDVDRDEATGIYYIVHEYVDGGSMRSMLAKGPLAEKSALRVLDGVARALVAAEKLGIVHRDIKPDNILFTKDGHVKLADLGLAKEVAGPQVTQSTIAMGTPAYMSPEQIDNPKAVDHRSDLFSLGATMYHLLVGFPPFAGDTVVAIYQTIMTGPTPDPRQHRPNVSARTAGVCMKLMARDPARRYASAADVLEELRLGGEAKPTGVLAQLERRKGFIATIGAAIAIAILAAFALSLKWTPEEQGGRPPVGGPPGTTPKKPVAPVEAASGLPATLSEGLLVAMGFDESADRKDVIEWRDNRTTVIKDQGPRRNHGTGRNGAAIQWERGRIGGALGLDAKSPSYVEFPAMDEKTVAMWVWSKSDIPENQRGVVFYDGGTNGAGAGRARLIGMFRPGGFNPRLGLKTHGVLAGFWYHDVLVPCDEIQRDWHHVVVSYEGAKVTIQFDGKLLPGLAGTYDSMRPMEQPFELPAAPASDGGKPTLLGGVREAGYPWVDRQYFTGLIDEFAVWDRPLTAGEMKALWDASSTGKSYCQALKQ